MTTRSNKELETVTKPTVYDRYRSFINSLDFMLVHLSYTPLVHLVC